MSDLNCGMDVRLALVLCVLTGSVSAESASAKSRSCAAFRQFYSSKGFSMSGVPQAQISGEWVRKLCNSVCESKEQTEHTGAWHKTGQSVKDL